MCADLMSVLFVVVHVIIVLQTMVVPEEREGKSEDDPNLSRGTLPANATVNTRKGGGPVVPVQQRVVKSSELITIQNQEELMSYQFIYM